MIENFEKKKWIKKSENWTEDALLVLFEFCSCYIQTVVFVEFCSCFINKNLQFKKKFLSQKEIKLLKGTDQSIKLGDFSEWLKKGRVETFKNRETEWDCCV